MRLFVSNLNIKGYSRDEILALTQLQDEELDAILRELDAASMTNFS